MKIRLLFILLFSIVSFGQKNLIELKIDSITSFDSIPNERKFTFNYHIKNLSDKEVSFFLNPNNFTPNSRGSMSNTINYKIFQNEEFFDFENVFVNKKIIAFNKALEEAKTQEEKNSIFKKFMKDEMKMDMDSMIKKSEKELLKEDQDALLSSIIRIKPNEKITFSNILYWDKTRYHRIEDNEFYLNEDKTHYIEFSINLMKEEFKNRLEPKEYEKIINNPNFIKGGFTSNKMEINFKE